MPLTDEQRLRMEENRRKAMEKRQQANQAESTISNETKSLNVTEQKLRMEENRRKALEIRQQKEKDKLNQNSSSINQNDQAIPVVENKPAILFVKSGLSVGWGWHVHFTLYSVGDKECDSTASRHYTKIEN